MSTYKCPTIIIWGYGYSYNVNLNLIKYQEKLNNVKVLGITGKNIYHKRIDAYPCIPIDQLCMIKFDYLVIASGKYYCEIRETAVNLGYAPEKIIDVRVFSIPNFNFANYVELVEARISIIANNCWGGIVYHLLGMQFLSPFVNMYELGDDYIRLLQNLKYYIGQKIEFMEWSYSSLLKKVFPIYSLDGIKLFFNHYDTQEEVEDKWYKRVSRINWDNLFIMMYTEDMSIAEQFEELDYEKKVCFVPFECDLKSAYTLKKPDAQLEFWEVANGIPGNQFIDYNVIDMLCGIGEKHERLR